MVDVIEFWREICINLNSRLGSLDYLYCKIYIILISYVYVHFLDSSVLILPFFQPVSLDLSIEGGSINI